MLFGHRNDVEGYARALEEADAWVPSLLGEMGPGDLAIFCADHGCDPTTPSTDHSREIRRWSADPPGARWRGPGHSRHVERHRTDGSRELRRRDYERNEFLTRIMRTPLMAGNWKMYKTPAETKAFFDGFLPLVAESKHCEVAICPPFVNIPTAVEATRGTRVGVGAQNLYWKNEGAFTGEISGPMIKATGAEWVIIGHSERRQYFGETDATVLERTKAALAAGLRPIVCVGGTGRARS